jgi:hypothetical protein
VINTASNAVTTTIPVGDLPIALGIFIQPPAPAPHRQYSPGSRERQTASARACRRWPSSMAASITPLQLWGIPACRHCRMRCGVLRGLSGLQKIRRHHPPRRQQLGGLPQRGPPLLREANSLGEAAAQKPRQLGTAPASAALAVEARRAGRAQLRPPDWDVANARANAALRKGRYHRRRFVGMCAVYRIGWRW